MSKHPLERPADSAGALYFPTPVTPEEAFQAIGRLRKQARDEIDRLIGFLDKTDDYVSRELEDAVDDGPIDDNELEPSLGSFDRMADQSKSWKRIQGEFGAEEDAEKDTCDDEPTEDSEPSLGSGATHEHSTQGSGLWANPGRGVVDAEDEHDGAEPDDECDGKPDDEPALGWTVDGCLGATSERKDECELAEPTGAPQGRTAIPATLTVENRYCGRRTILGLSEPQQRAVKARMSRDGEISCY